MYGFLYGFCAFYAGLGIPGGWIVAIGIPYGATPYITDPLVKMAILIGYGITWVAALITAIKLADHPEAEKLRQNFDTHTF